MIKNKKII